MKLDVPTSITVEQATHFAESVVLLMNERGWDITPERFVSVEVTPTTAEVAVIRERNNQQWTEASPVATFHIDEANDGDFTSERIEWCESIGLDPIRTMDVSLRPNYLQVTGFVERADGARVLRQDGSGYLKYTIDIPIIENGDSK